MQLALQQAKFEVNNTTIQIFVPNQVTKDMVMQETNLLDRLREELVVPGLTFVAEIDLGRFPDYEDNKFVPVLSQRDRYLVMTQNNPQFEHLIQKFALKLDTGN